MSKTPSFAAVTYETLKCENNGAIATITLNRPEKRNAISGTMIEELLAALNAAEADAAVRVVILTGAGKAFCSGMDLETLQAIAGQSADEQLADSRQMARMFHRLYSFPKPLITAVNGAAVAGGCGIATFSDITSGRAGSEVRLHGSAHRIYSGAGVRAGAQADGRKARARATADGGDY